MSKLDEVQSLRRIENMQHQLEVFVRAIGYDVTKWHQNRLKEPPKSPYSPSTTALIHTLYSENDIPKDTDVGVAFSVLPPPARLRLYTKMAEEGKGGEVVGDELQTGDGDQVERPKTEFEVKKMMRDSKRRRQKFKGVKRKGGLMERQADLVKIMMSSLTGDEQE